MSKVKRILSVIMAMVMVLAMSVPTFATVVGTAAEGKAALTVTGLVPEEATEVRVYKVVEWDAANSAWKLAQGVGETDVNLNVDPVVINWNNFVGKRASLQEVAHAENVTDGAVTFNGLEVGAYYVYAASEKTTYNPMGEAVYKYDETTGLMVADNKTIDAKGATYTLTKAFEGEDGETTYQVVERGQEVPFTITAVFPSYDKATTDRAFQITDEPTGMKVTEVTVKVNGVTLTPETDYKLVGVNEDNTDGAAVTLPAAENTKVRVRFTSDYIGTSNAHAGQTVVVTVKAQITDADSFSNKASSDKGSNIPNVDGKLGSIAINKYDENGKAGGKLLAGAEFSIAPAGDDTAKIQFVLVEKKDSNGVSVYKKATAEEINNADIVKVTNIVAEDGKVIAKGLDDGEYKIVEEKAPAGYSVVPVKNAIITNGANPTVEVDVADTQLHSLPHTGGIGTTIFTIGGCAIMIVAAGLFFATRRKTQK